MPEDIVETWHDLLARHARTNNALERALSPHGLGVSEFEVLDQLAALNECRMQELSGLVHLSQSALSRAVARLEADGLVVRGICPEDRRGIKTQLTEAGHERLAAARPAHRQVLAAQLGA